MSSSADFLSTCFLFGSFPLQSTQRLGKIPPNDSQCCPMIPLNARSDIRHKSDGPWTVPVFQNPYRSLTTSIVNTEHSLRKCLIKGNYNLWTTAKQKLLSFKVLLKIWKASGGSCFVEFHSKTETAVLRRKEKMLHHSRSDGWGVSRVDTWAVQLPCKVNINTSAGSSYQATCSSPAESGKQLKSAWQMQAEDEPRNEIHPAPTTSAPASNWEPRPRGKVTLVQVDSAEGEASTL